MLCMNVWEQMHSRLDDLERADLLRTPPILQSPCGTKVRLAGREIVCFSSNDYLSLANDPGVKAAAANALRRWGLGAGASRLISGTMSPHAGLEEQLAEFKHVEAAVVTSTGWIANHVAIHAMVGEGDLILSDKLNHASIIDAALSSGARVRTFPHCDVARVETLLQRHRGKYRRCLIATDSLFSMDGDLAPLRKLVELKNCFDAQLLIDEAHATGVLGVGGRGAAELLGVEDDVDVTVGTLSKAIGALGGFVAAKKILTETIRNTSRAFIYTTALPPMICAAVIAALRIVRKEPDRRSRLLDLGTDLRRKLAEAGVNTGNSVSQIIPVLIGPAGRAVRISQRLLEEGYFVPAIRPPSVPKGTSRLRISLCAKHEEADLEGLVEVLRAALQLEGSS
jgi:8-amino-7-oxononanoate synthase